MNELSRSELHQMVLTLVMAKLQADGRALNNISNLELNCLIEDAVEDIKLARREQKK